MKRKIENKRLDWRKYLLYTLSAAMLTAPAFALKSVQAAEPESEYTRESGQESEGEKGKESFYFVGV